MAADVDRHHEARGDMYGGKKVLVTGGTGLIGIPVVQMLLDRGADVRVASLDDPTLVNPAAEFLRGNLTEWAFCQRVVRGMDYVFHLAGTKGPVTTGRARAASFFVPHLLFNTLMMEAARLGDIDRYLFASTIGVYPASDVPKKEDIAWSAPPHESNLYAGWAKRMGELQAEAYKVEFGWDKIAIVRPAHVYGPYDYFESASSMVIPSLICRAVAGEDPFVVWGTGSAVRDFLYADDCAEGVLLALEKAADCTPINLASGTGTTIRELVNTIAEIIPGLHIRFDRSKPEGEPVRVLDIGRARQRLGWEPRVSLRDGLARTIEWYRRHRGKLPKHYDVFAEKQLIA